jgi:hypothetical protein
MDSQYVKEYIAILDKLTEEGVSRFANTADFYDKGIEGPNGQRTTIDTSTGKVKTAGAGGTDVTSVQGTPISRTTPDLNGASVKTYTGSAQGKGIASGGQKVAYNDGPMQANQYKGPAGNQTAANMSYDMGVAKATVDQQGDENAPIQTSMKYTQPNGSYGENPPAQQGDKELEEMRRLAFGKQELDEAPPTPTTAQPAPTTAQANTFNAVNSAAGPAVNQMTQAGEKWQAGNKVGAAVDAAKALNNVANASGATFGDKVAGVGSALKAGGNAALAYMRGKDPAAAAAGSVASDLTQPFADYTNSEDFASDFHAGMSNGGNPANPLQKAYNNNLVNADSVRNAANSMNKTANQLKSGDANAMKNYEAPSLYRDDQTPYLDIQKRQAVTQQPVQTKAEIQADNPVSEGDDDLAAMRRIMKR